VDDVADGAHLGLQGLLLLGGGGEQILLLLLQVGYGMSAFPSAVEQRLGSLPFCFKRSVTSSLA